MSRDGCEANEGQNTEPQRIFMAGNFTAIKFREGLLHAFKITVL